MSHNIPLMRMIHRQIISNPNNHDQGDYRLCVAGWAIKLDGHWGLLRLDAEIGAGIQVLDFRTGETGYTDVIAARLLGLVPDEAHYLFQVADNHAAVAWLEDAIATYDGRILDALDWPIGEVTA
ncbi:hypothetical protein [Nocardia sp. NPDC049707]|uniref:hypothetical protein n=1 Tax=Nocardia sp. NPDC049707 TaxID=3154735 RepID=UPI00343EDAB9